MVTGLGSTKCIVYYLMMGNTSHTPSLPLIYQFQSFRFNVIRLREASVAVASGAVAVLKSASTQISFIDIYLICIVYI